MCLPRFLFAAFVVVLWKVAGSTTTRINQTDELAPVSITFPSSLDMNTSLVPVLVKLHVACSGATQLLKSEEDLVLKERY